MALLQNALSGMERAFCMAHGMLCGRLHAYRHVINGYRLPGATVHSHFLLLKYHTMKAPRTAMAPRAPK